MGAVSLPFNLGRIIFYLCLSFPLLLLVKSLCTRVPTMNIFRSSLEVFYYLTCLKTKYLVFFFSSLLFTCVLFSSSLFYIYNNIYCPFGLFCFWCFTFRTSVILFFNIGDILCSNLNLPDLNHSRLFHCHFPFRLL